MTPAQGKAGLKRLRPAFRIPDTPAQMCVTYTLKRVYNHKRTPLFQSKRCVAVR